MYELDTLEATVREKLARELRDQNDGKFDESLGGCPALWVLHDLVGLMIEFHDRPVNEICPMIRRLITEQRFVDENGDNIMDDKSCEAVERHVQMIVGVLEKVRLEAGSEGCWSNAPVTPLMFG